MNKRKILAIIFFSFVMTICIYGFLFGPLFPFSPIKPGFTELKLNHCTIFYPKDTQLSPEYTTVDSLMAATERFHKLEFKEKIRIIVCETKEQYKRFSMSGGHACAIQTGTVIYMSPSIQETTYPPQINVDGNSITLIPPSVNSSRDFTGFLKHELSHAILYQNTSLMKALRIKRWVEEGVAVYFGNPHHYYRDSEFKILSIDQDCFFNLLDDYSEPTYIPKEIKYFFMYGAFHEFMNYLIETYGINTVLNFMHEYIKTPEQEDLLFKSFFEKTPQNELERFQEYVRTL